MKKIKNFAILFCLTMLIYSCGEYQQALKSEDISVKYQMAEKMYEQKKYSKAVRLFEQIAPSYTGKPQAEKLFYMYAMSTYNLKQYQMAGYLFEDRFYRMYPRSEKSEEALFMAAKSYSELSPKYSLDQVDTITAIEKLQSFIDKYPNSELMPQANALMESLNTKIEKKYFEIAKQYNQISDHKSAVVSFDNFLINYPGSIYKDEAMYYKFDSMYILAVNSVPAKKVERLNQAKQAYESLSKTSLSDDMMKEAKSKFEEIELELKNISK